MSKAVIILAEGAEEMEAVILVDILRRAQWEVTVAGLREGLVTASRGMVLGVDCALESLRPEEYDVLLLPGGLPGTKRLMESELTLRWVRGFMEQGKRIGAICAAPRVLYRAGVLQGHRATCYPGHEKEMPGFTHSSERVVVDGQLVTSQGPGTAMEFALTLIALHDGPVVARRVAEGLLTAPPQHV